MQPAYSRSVRFGIIASLVILLALVPSLARAQSTNTELRDTVRSALLSDPRTTNLSQTEIDTMVDILTTQAQAQGMTARDIQWQPFSFINGAPPRNDVCDGLPQWVCMINSSFGFIGLGWGIALSLGLLSGLLCLIIGLKLRHHHAQVHARQMAEASSQIL